MRWSILLAALLISAPMFACINDRDSRRVQKEANPDDPMRGLPPIPEVLRGRFDRYPPQYFEMRRDRVELEIKTDTKNYGLYDDLAVAYDRLGDNTTAIAWMEKKLIVLEANRNEADPEWNEHWYSYHANLGTFYAHRWLTSGAQRADMADLHTGCDLITKAIQIRPDAHFGRERYQLIAMAWFASGPEYKQDTALPNLLGLGNDEISGASGGDVLKAKGLHDAVLGISGLIVLGTAWESLDATYALGLALRMNGDVDNAYVALLRCEELIGLGRGSMAAGAPTGERLVAMMRLMLPPPAEKERADALGLKFGNERGLANKWQKDRTDKMTTLMATGRHPDTDAKFWEEVNGVTPPATTEPEKSSGPWLWIGLATLVALAVGGASFTMMRRGKNTPPPVKPTQIGKARADTHSP